MNTTRPNHPLKLQFFRTIAAVILLTAAPILAADEITISDAELKKMDGFEMTNINKADKLFDDKDYVAALAAYDAFIEEFKRSPALAYASFRKARSRQMTRKINKAIRDYEDVVAVFPDDYKYAAAAQYYIGDCHAANGDAEQAIKAWRKMVENPEFVKQPLAAAALNQLSDHMLKRGEVEKAVQYFAQVAETFRTSHPESARAAMAKAIQHYIRTQPDEGKLRVLYEKTKGFEGDPIRWDGEVAAQRKYWERLRGFVRDYGRFEEKDAEARANYYQYWGTAFEGKFPDWDDLQTDAACYFLIADKDATRYVERLEKQFNAYQKPGDTDRIIRFIQLLGAQRSKATEFIGKLEIDKLTDAQLDRLIRVSFEDIKDPAMAKTFFAKLHMEKMTDQQKFDLQRFLWQYKDDSLISELCQNMQDKELGLFELVNYYHWNNGGEGNRAKLMLCADQLKQSAKFGSQAYMKKGDCYWWENKFAEAMREYKGANNPPENLFRVADCHVRMGKIDLADAQYRQIEADYKAQAARAALEGARLYNNEKDKETYVARLRQIMKRYPNSPESSVVHEELERLKAVNWAVGGVTDPK